MLALLFLVIVSVGSFFLGSLGVYLYDEKVPLYFIPLILFSFIILIHVVIFSYIFAIAWFARSHRPEDMRIQFKETLRLVFGEISFSMVLYLFLTPLAAFQWLKEHLQSNKGSHDDVPVLLVHGFFCNSAFWVPMKRYLSKRGFTRTYSVTLDPPLFGDIEKFSNKLAKRVEQICSETKTEKVVIVAHSMGGLVSRNYIYNRGGDKRVEKLITLGTPHHGTTIADTVFFLGRHLRQMKRWSNKWLANLNLHEGQTALVPTVSIFSYHDSIVSPQDSPILKHARNIPLRGVGHLEMPVSKVVQELVYEELVPAIHKRTEIGEDVSQLCQGS
ncbi:lipase family alpha/beta hydrolase [Alkalimarinus coralli]|uniref:lipase family alpha/beta hydrolase n=1 Tax=Alkalimarinus coralli TaxID=2935863 RepID=UPI00202B39FC|nr:alpha/beta fold hydrolase [Alkalimarinus coralli]